MTREGAGTLTRHPLHLLDALAEAICPDANDLLSTFTSFAMHYTTLKARLAKAGGKQEVNPKYTDWLNIIDKRLTEAQKQL